tara:strand:- start:281 stop:718 length:438 start_codon:yes stop_codon:yes gene_type:complete
VNKMVWFNILKATEEQRIEDAKNYVEPADLAGPNKNIKHIESILDYIIKEVTVKLQKGWNFPIKTILSMKASSNILLYHTYPLMSMTDKEIEEEMKTLLQKPKYKKWPDRNFPHDFSNLIIEVTYKNYPDRFIFTIEKDNVKYNG